MPYRQFGTGQNHGYRILTISLVMILPKDVKGQLYERFSQLTPGVPVDTGHRENIVQKLIRIDNG